MVHLQIEEGKLLKSLAEQGAISKIGKKQKIVIVVVVHHTHSEHPQLHAHKVVTAHDHKVKITKAEKPLSKSKIHRGLMKFVHSTTYKHFFDVLIGKKHTKTHRITCGIVVMAAGVCIAKSAHHFTEWYSEYSIDLVGYFIHGLGATPLLELLTEAEELEA